MATSFKTLRQYEKVGLIILGVIVMIVFTLGDYSSLLGGRGRGNQGGNEAKGAKLVTWRGGSLNQGQLEQIARDHRNVIEVENEILRTIAKDKKNPATPQVMPVMEASYEELINRYILASYAASIGMQIDDNTVRDFLHKLSGERLDNSQIRGILDDVVGDSPDARNRFFSWMRRELSAKAVERMIFAGQNGVAPQAAWDEFRKITQRAQIEFLRLPVAKYVDQIKDRPAEAELRTLYDELKGRARRADRPDMGVYHPEEVAFEWVKADFETYVTDEMKKVTDAQVEEYYEKNKLNYKITKPAVQPPKTEENEKKPGGLEEIKPDETPDKAPTDSKFSEPPTEGEKPTEKPEEKPEQKPAEEKPAEEKPATDEPAKPQEPAKPEESGAAPKKPDEELALVSFETQEPSQEKPAQEKLAQEKPAQEEPAEQKPAEEKQQEKKADEPAAPPPENSGEKPQEPAAQEKPAEEKPAGEKPAEEKPAAQEEEFRPLSEVADKIRRDLAAPAADKRYKAALQDAEAELRALWKKVNLGDGKIDEAALKKFDLEAFAKKYQFTTGVIPLSPPDVAATMEGLGKFEGFVANAYFNRKGMLYEPQMITNPYGLSIEAYIYWRTEQKEAFEPTFEQAKEDLEAAWKFNKAKELAKEDAKKKAAEVKQGKTLKETFPSENVLVTGEFTAKSMFSSGVSTIPEISNADAAFMKGVFDLKPLQATSLPLDNEAEYYVVYLSKYDFTEKDLRDQFAKFPVVAELARMADSQENQTRIAAFEEFRQALDVQFVAPTVEEE